MNSKIFLSRQTTNPESPNILFLLREAVTLLFPKAVLVDGPEAPLRTPHSFFLRSHETLLWAEVFFQPFARTEICDYLARLKQIRSAFPSGVCGILAAPAFEDGAPELLELSRMNLRIFRYHEIIPFDQQETESSQNLLHESSLWIEEISSSDSKKQIHFIRPLQEKKEGKGEEEPWVDKELISSWNRLSREELREFVQLELDWLSQT